MASTINVQKEKVMLKGIQKNMIYVQLPKSNSFESAYFVIRSRLPDRDVRQGEMIKEANRIIYESELTSANKKRRTGKIRKDRALFFLYGMLAGACSVAVAWLIVLLEII